MKVCLKILMTLLLSMAAAAQNVNATEFEDFDHDGLDDGLEQQLLVKFLPKFLVSVDDCDGLPAEFVAGSSTPILLAKNGAIYGQVFRHSGDESNVFLEIHYFHLWNRDCGRLGHYLDPEHVSTLIRADHINDNLSSWRAFYWYAAAHEDTLCDVSQASDAELLQATDRGPTVWISKGKHASFLSQSKCRLGCGENRCERMKVIATGNPINIGEIAFPINGTLWAQSEQWMLKPKFRSDFTPQVLARLSVGGRDGIINVNTPPPPTQAVLFGGNSSFGAFLIGNRSTGKALSIAGLDAVDAVGKAFCLAGKSLLLVARKVQMLPPKAND